MAPRGTASERRQAIRQVAARAFAERGLHGVSVDTIAREIGISEAYVFRLFGTKRALFIDVVTRAYDTMTKSMSAAAGSSTGPEALVRMASEYTTMIADPERLALQLQGLAACSDPIVREAVREAFRKLWIEAEVVSGVHPVGIKIFMAVGMLTKDLAALDLADADPSWTERTGVDIPLSVFS